MFRNRPVSLALVGLFVWLTACSSYKHIEVDKVADHGKIRVTTTDGERETIHEPRVETDSIKGLVSQGRPQPTKHPWAIPLDQVIELEASGTNVVGTVALAVLGAGLVAAAIALSTYEMCILSC